MNETNLMPVRVIESMQARHRKPVKVLSGTQTKVLRDEMRPFMDEDMEAVVPPNALFFREIKHEGIEYQVVRYGETPSHADRGIRF